MARFKIVDGVKIAYTAEEEAARDAEEKAWEDGALDRALDNLRRDRTKKLQQSDWMANSDVTMTDAWKTYRQQLRDLPSGLDTVDKVNNVTWPSEPS
jgi:hypothetical protein